MLLTGRRSLLFGSLLCAGGMCCGLGSQLEAEPQSPHLSKSAEGVEGLADKLDLLNQRIAAQPSSLTLFSQRGDVLFFLGKYPEAVADYQKMVELDPKQAISHWRLGIALFYNDQAKAAAAQFDRYHAFDNIDRENGIWRYFSHFRAFGKVEARKQLLKYEKDDREPFGDVYRLFSGEMTGDVILNKIQAADISAHERQKRLFYANLYIGLNSSVEGDSVSAKRALQAAVESTWPRQAGYGPHYMWHVGRLHLQPLPASP